MAVVRRTWFTAVVTLVVGLIGNRDATAAELSKISGRVVVDANANGQLDPDERGLAGVAVTDGVQFVLTGEDGSYEITLADDEVIPFQPARTIAVSWPSGTWPTSQWWRRLSTVKPGEAVNFGLRQEEQSLPFGIIQGTDPHDSFRRDFNHFWRDDVKRMGDLIRFAVITGDLSYMGPDNADKDFSDIRTFTRNFPVPMFHAPGNHDIVGIHQPEWKKPDDIYGNGAFTKYLGPVRWSFTHAGVHICGIDWARPMGETLECGTPDVAIRWFQRDLELQQPGTRTIVFMHQFASPNPRFVEVAKRHNVELMLGGHSHRNMDLSQPGLRLVTTMSLSKIVHVGRDGLDFVEFCPGYRGGIERPDRHHGNCRLFVRDAYETRHGRHVNVAAQRLNDRALEMIKPQLDAFELSLSLVPLDAKRYGVRLIDGDGTTFDVAIDGHQLRCLGLTTASGLRPTDPDVLLHLLLDAGRLEVRANGRVYFDRKFKVERPIGVSLFAEDGSVTVKSADLWQLTGDDAKPLIQLAGDYSSHKLFLPNRAIEYLGAALDADLENEEARRLLATTLFKQGRFDDAAPHFQAIADRHADDINTHHSLAKIHAAGGRFDEAIAAYRQVIRLQPDSPQPINELAWLLLTAADTSKRDAKEAARLAEQVCALTKYSSAPYLDTLCAAQAELGQFNEAIETAKTALGLAEKSGDRILADLLRNRIQAFAQGKIY